YVADVQTVGGQVVQGLDLGHAHAVLLGDLPEAVAAGHGVGRGDVAGATGGRGGEQTDRAAVLARGREAVGRGRRDVTSGAGGGTRRRAGDFRAAVRGTD